MRGRCAAILVSLLGGLLALAALTAAAQDTGWTIERFHAAITVQPDASLRITEAIDVDFQSLQRHGIFRDIPIRYAYDRDHNRVYRLEVIAVTDAQGKPWPYEQSRQGAFIHLRIGDPNRTVSGRQSYRITYRLQGALNAFPTHDELYWNVNGADWPVPTLQVSATVQTPGGIERVACYQGAQGSTEPCAARFAAGTAEYASTRPFAPGEQLTIVTGMRKGVVAEPRPILEARPRDARRYFEAVNGLTLGATALVLAAGLGLLSWNWWTRGRDRRYTTLYYLTDNPEEETRPLFARYPIVVELQPPEHLKPAQMGLILDERVDTKDVTATIIDLAVHGYLTITELRPTGVLPRLFGHKDWLLIRRRADTDKLAEYERAILDGLFRQKDEVTLSSLENHFYKDLKLAKNALYRDALARKWFNGNPDHVRTIWRAAGAAVIVLGVGVTVGLGYRFGAGMVGLPVVLTGVLLFLTAGAMPRRTAKGSELLRRILGFRQYLVTAETDRQRFNERANIFAEYLPYAIVFGAVGKWARAFRGIDTQAAVASWYQGTTAFDAQGFSRVLASFSNQVTQTIASTPGGSGASGFDGGSAGGGGGGGGGGSW